MQISDTRLGEPAGYGVILVDGSRVGIHVQSFAEAPIYGF